MTRRQLVLLLVLAWFCTLCASPARADEQDPSDYSSIPILRWAGPGEPGTYADYKSGRVDGPPVFDRVDLPVPDGLPTDKADQKLLVLVENDLYTALKSRIDRYVTDVQGKSYTVTLTTYSSVSASDVKDTILANKTDLIGAVFIGDIPAAWYENADDYGEGSTAEFPCDLYYMDLDGTWSDSDSDDKYDGHTDGSGDTAPEIFVSRIDASMMTSYGTESELLSDYFDKLHEWYGGNSSQGRYGLTYTDKDWASFGYFSTHMGYAYDNLTSMNYPNISKSDYQNSRLTSANYDIIQVSVHSSSSLHAFENGGNLAGSTIWSTQPKAVMYNLFCCSGMRFTDANFLGGTYLYSPSQTALAAVGSTKTGSMLQFSYFYEPLGEDKTFGQSFQEWFAALAPYTDTERSWHYGMTLAGDPMITRNEKAEVPTLNEWGAMLLALALFGAVVWRMRREGMAV